MRKRRKGTPTTQRCGTNKDGKPIESTGPCPCGGFLSESEVRGLKNWTRKCQNRRRAEAAARKQEELTAGLRVELENAQAASQAEATRRAAVEAQLAQTQAEAQVMQKEVLRTFCRGGFTRDVGPSIE